MKAKIKLILIVICLGLLLSSSFASAQGLVPANCQRGATTAGGANCNLNDLKDLMINMINYLIRGAGFVTLLFMVWGGIKMLFSGGNPEQVKSGKSTLYNAIIGFVIVLAVYLIINLTLSAIGAAPTDFENLIQFWN